MENSRALAAGAAGPTRLVAELQFCKHGPLRERVVQIVIAVVEVIDAAGQAPLAAELVVHAQVGHHEPFETGVGMAVDVGVVDRAVLLAAVAGGQGDGPFVGWAVSRHGRGAPLWYIRRVHADLTRAVSRCNVAAL